MISSQNCSKAPQLLTYWSAKDRHDQQDRIAARHHSHPQTGEPRTGMISRLELQQDTTATHILRARTGMISSLELQQCTTATHRLKSQGQA